LLRFSSALVVTTLDALLLGLSRGYVGAPLCIRRALLWILRAHLWIVRSLLFSLSNA